MGISGKNRVISVIFLMVTVSIFFDRFWWEKVFCVGVKNGIDFFKVFGNFLGELLLPLFCIFSNYLYDDITRTSTKDVFSIENGTYFVWPNPEGQRLTSIGQIAQH